MLSNIKNILLFLFIAAASCSLLSSVGCSDGVLTFNYYEPLPADPRFEGEFSRSYPDNNNDEITLFVSHEDSTESINGMVNFVMLHTGTGLHPSPWFHWEMLHGTGQIDEVGAAHGSLHIEFPQDAEGNRITEHCDMLLELIPRDEDNECPDQIRLSCDESDSTHYNYYFTLNRQTPCS